MKYPFNRKLAYVLFSSIIAAKVVNVTAEILYFDNVKTNQKELFLKKSDTKPPASKTNTELIAETFFTKKQNRKKEPGKIVNSGKILKNASLLGIYIDNEKSIAVISIDSKTYTVSKGEHAKGYKLASVGKDYAVLEKNGKRFAIRIKNRKAPPGMEIKDVKKQLFSIEGRIAEKIKENPFSVIKSIGFKRTKEGDVLITSIKRDSPLFGSIEKGDRIVSINGVRISDMQNGQKLASTLKKGQTVSLVVKRDGEIKEIEYEIR